MKKFICLLLVFVGVIALAGCGAKKDSVIIYSCMEKEREEVLQERLKEKFPNKKVVLQHMSTGNTAAKVKNEGENIEADIVIDLETSHMDSLKDNFADLSGTKYDVYLDSIKNDNNYLMWTKYPIGIIINKKYFEEHNLDIPKTYNDLLDKKYKGLIAMPDPKTSGSGYSFYLNVVNIMGEDKAIEYFKELKKNVREFTTSGSGPTNLLKQGEIQLAMGMVSEAVQAINEGYELEIIELATGTPYNTTSLGIVKGRDTKDGVKEVFDYIVNEFGPWDKENFVLGNLYKNQKSAIKNNPTNLKDADMKNISSIEVKNKLTERWNEING